MEDIQVFKNPEFGEIRTTVINDEVWFVGKDVAEALGYSNARDALYRHVEEEDKQTSCFTTGGQNYNMNIINESGLYSLTLSSKLASAKKFKRWVTSDVLPSIRKHGAYMTEQTLNKALTSPDFLIQLATQLKEEQAKRAQLESKVTAKGQQYFINGFLDGKFKLA